MKERKNMQICAAVDRVYEAMSLLSCVADGFRPLESQRSMPCAPDCRWTETYAAWT